MDGGEESAVADFLQVRTMFEYRLRCSEAEKGSPWGEQRGAVRVWRLGNLSSPRYYFVPILSLTTFLLHTLHSWIIDASECIHLQEKPSPTPSNRLTPPLPPLFLQILEEHRKNCERQGKYVEAEIAKNRLEELKLHEENRRKEAMRSRQIAERLGVEEAHMLEFQQFNMVWDKKMEAYEGHAETLVEAMKVRMGREGGGLLCVWGGEVWGGEERMKAIKR